MIKFLDGDATEPVGKGLKIVCHVCNDIGRWGKGFVVAVSDRWPETRKKFLQLGNWPLGEVQLIQVTDDIIIANMIAQNGIGKPNQNRIDYEALTKCLKQVAEYAKTFNCTIHMPRIGAGLGGAPWNEIRTIIETSLTNLSVTIYNY